jgi:hypothetical protein
MNPQAAQQLALQTSLMQQQQQQQRREGMKSQCMLKLMQFSEHLNGYPVCTDPSTCPTSVAYHHMQGPRVKDDLSYWNAFVGRFFSSNGVFRHSLHITENEESTDKQYEIAFPAIARYLHTHFSSGVKSMQLILGKGTIDRPLHGDCYSLENSKSSLVYWFDSGSHVGLCRKFGAINVSC